MAVTFKGSLKNHTKGVNCVRCKGAHLSAHCCMSATHQVHCCTSLHQLSLQLTHIAHMCTRGALTKSLSLAHAGQAVVTAGDGGEMMVWGPAEPGAAVEAWKVTQLLRCG